jgi:hypothetical protein
MRLKSKLLGLVMSLGLIVVSPAAQAFHYPKAPVAPEGYHAPRTVHHWVYKPRYHHVYHVSHSADPYAYRYSPRGYYPYYASRYWVPAHQMKSRYRYSYSGPKYTYYPAWGLKKHSHKAHRTWHAKRHGYHHRWHW